MHAVRRGGRAAECTGLENRRWATIRGFKSHLLRHLLRKPKRFIAWAFLCICMLGMPLMYASWCWLADYPAAQLWTKAILPLVIQIGEHVSAIHHAIVSLDQPARCILFQQSVSYSLFPLLLWTANRSMSLPSPGRSMLHSIWLIDDGETIWPRLNPAEGRGP